MATATTMAVRFRGLQTGQRQSVSGYISDVIGAKVTWNQSGAAVAGSDTTLQFDEDVVIEDVSILTGPTVATGFNWYVRNVIISASATLISPNLTTNAQRSFPVLGFKKAALISAVQF